MGKKSKILVVDDDQDFAASLGDLISDHGFDVTTVCNGEDALAAYERHAFDLVFMDKKMPGMDGIACIVELRKRYPDIRVVMVSGHYDDCDLLKVINFGLFGVLDKPVDIERLSHILEKLKSAPVILVADDDPICSYAVSRMLAAQGYRVRRAENGRQAVDMVKQGSIGLMILDMYMPVMNGHQVCMELRATDCLPPTIFTTAFPDGDLMHAEAVIAGPGIECLIKPIGTQQLYKAVDSMLTGNPAHE